MLQSSLKLETLNNLTYSIKGRSLDSDLKCLRRSFNKAGSFKYPE